MRPGRGVESSARLVPCARRMWLERKVRSELRRRRGRSSTTRAAGLDELRAVGRDGTGKRGDRGGDFLGWRRAVDADAAIWAHLPAQHERSLAAAAGALQPRLTPRAEDELGLDPLLADRV